MEEGVSYPITNVINLDKDGIRLPHSLGDCYYGHWNGAGSHASGSHEDGEFFVAVYAPIWAEYEDWFYLEPAQLRQNTLFDGDPYLEEKLKCLSYRKHDKCQWVIVSQTKAFIPPTKPQPLTRINLNAIEDAGIF